VLTFSQQVRVPAFNYYSAMPTLAQTWYLLKFLSAEDAAFGYVGSSLSWGGNPEGWDRFCG
jgi:hypothetical protein